MKLAHSQDLWEYTTRGQTFDNLGAAESHMRNATAYGPHLTRVETTGLTSSTQTILYDVEPTDPVVGDWTYNYSNTFSPSAAGAEAAMVSNLEQNLNANCAGLSVSVSATSGWVDDDPPFLGFERNQLRNYQGDTWSWSGSAGICRPNTVNGLSMRRTRAVGCTEFPTTTADTVDNKCTSNDSGIITKKPLMCAVTPPGAQTLWGNPCDASTGEKIERVTDYDVGGLTFKRFYRSLSPGGGISMGRGWQHEYEDRLLIDSVSGDPVAYLGARRAQGELVPVPSTNYFISISESSLVVESVNGSWYAYRPNGGAEIFDVTSGLMTAIMEPGGAMTTISRDSQDRVISVDDPYGKSLTIEYDTDGNLSKVTDPSGGEIIYAYGEKFAVLATVGNAALVSVTYQDGSSNQYLYEDPSVPFGLTGIIDGNGNRYSTYAYGIRGRAISTEKAGGQEKYTFDYQEFSTTITDPIGTVSTLSFQNNSSEPRRISAFKRTASSPSMGYVHEPVGTFFKRRVTSAEDENGNETQFSYDAFHLTAKTEALNSSNSRQTNYAYLDDVTNLTTTLTEESVSTTGTFPTTAKTTTTQYSAARLPEQVTISGFRPDGTAVSSTVAMTYDSFGKPLTVDGPRTDLSDVTTFEYYNCATGDECGQLFRVTNAAGHQTTYNAYDSRGRLTSMTEPNGLVTSYTYDARDRLLTETKTPTVGTARTTTYTYDSHGQLLTAAFPDGLTLTYQYDNAHYLASVTDQLGNSISYAYDLKGNQTNETIRDSSNAIKLYVDTAFDAKNRVDTVNRGGFGVVSLSYDDNGNGTNSQDQLLRNTASEFDQLNRLTKITDALSGETLYAYDENDNVNSVTAPNGAVTTYVIDDLGRTISETSPDRGTTAYTYNDAGLVLTKTDARGKVATYTYDALGRKLTESYADGEIITFTYDAAPNGIGRVATMTDSSGTTSWEYSEFGEITKTTRTVLNFPLVVDYGYDAAGRMTSMTYPSGRVVSYTWSDHLVTGINVDATTIFSGATYEPFGPANGWTWGPGLVMALTFDTRGLQTGHSLSGIGLTNTFDAAGQLTDVNDPRNNLDFTYDLLGRVTGLTAGPGTVSPLPASQAMSYDANGNRTLINENGTPFAYTNQTNSNRLLSTAGPIPRTIAYDAAGNTTGDGVNTYSYSDRGRVTSLNNGSVNYTYNAFGQRVIKDNGTPFVYMYDENGQTIAEYNFTTGAYTEHVFFEGRPVAVTRANGIFYVHTDHLGTPRLVTSGSNVGLWRWESDPFGSTAAQEDVDGNGQDFEYNLRFPGQLFDSETGLHYNYFRTYDPGTGRYLESDPIGLVGGSNSFRYALSNPMRYTDVLGLLPDCEILSQRFERLRDNRTAIENSRERFSRVFVPILGISLTDRIPYVDPSVGFEVLKVRHWSFERVETRLHKDVRHIKQYCTSQYEGDCGEIKEESWIGEHVIELTDWIAGKETREKFSGWNVVEVIFSTNDIPPLPSSRR
ncbi:MAG: RHS repeat-associated core domain-containing protein [Pseudomonadota bacterium]